MSLWNKTNKGPVGLPRRTRRNVILTTKGWVRRLTRSTGIKQKEEVLVPLLSHGNANTFITPIVTDVWWGNGTTRYNPQYAVNTPVIVSISFSEPVKNFGTGTLKLNVANTAGGSAKTATTANTTTFGANNHLRFVFTPTVAGTYFIPAQTIANGSTATATVRSTNPGSRAVSLLITGTQSNTSGSIKVV